MTFSNTRDWEFPEETPRRTIGADLGALAPLKKNLKTHKRDVSLTEMCQYCPQSRPYPRKDHTGMTRQMAP